MTDVRKLLSYHDLTVEVESSPGDELIQHISDTVLGTPGGFRYQHTDIADRLTNLGENYFMFLRKSGKMLGSVGFCGRRIQTDGFSHDIWFIRYFSIKAPMREIPRNSKKQEASESASKRTTVLGRFLQPIFNDPACLREHYVTEDGQGASPAIIYAIIEQKNLRSLNFSIQMGMEKMGEVINFSFNRLRPARSVRMEKLPRSEQGLMLELIREFYGDHTLFVPDPLFKDDQYFIIREAGRIVAGLQYYHVTWKIIDFGSRQANRLIRLFARLPWVSKRFDPDNLRLVALDGIYCEPHYESALYELMEGILERTGTIVAMLMMDKASSLFKIYSREKRLGVLNRLVGSFTSDIRVRFIGIPERVRKYYQDHPAYISTYDNS